MSVTLTKINVEQIAQQIKSGQYPREDIDITQFFTMLGNGEFIPNRATRIQVREVDRDLDFIDRVVNKCKQSGDTSGLEDLTCVYFPEENITKLLNGNHTAEIEIILKLYTGKACIVNFDTHLGGKMSNVIRLGNLLNKQDIEKTAVKSNDVKRELFQLMEERELEGLDPKPTDDILDEFVETYPHISRATIGQWMSHHQGVGGRKKPMRTYTPGELVNQRINFESQLDYINHAILEPRTLDSWDQTAIAEVFKQCMQEDKRKALVIFYCSTVKQVEKLTQTDIRTKIKSSYSDLSAYWGLQIDTVFLRYE